MENKKRWQAFALIGAGFAVAAFALAGCSPSVSQSQARSLMFCTFDVSPDGKTIAFAGSGNGGNNLFLLDLATSKVTPLTNTPADENYPAFSPDGKYVVYSSAKAVDQPCHLFLRSLDGKRVRQLTTTPGTDDEYPSFSPDGRKIAFSRSPHYVEGAEGGDTTTGFDVYMVNRDGSHFKQVTRLNGGGYIRPRFYSDNRHVLFDKTVVPTSGVVTSLARADTSGQQPVQDVLKFSGCDGWPCFFPDGKQIVFCGNFNGTLDLYRVSLTGGKPSKLLPGQTDTGFFNPVVTHDGKRIYCIERYSPTLSVMNSDGSGLHQVADGTLFSDPLHWKPK